MPDRSLEEKVHDLVAELAAELVPLIRKSALDAAREALERAGIVLAVDLESALGTARPSPRPTRKFGGRREAVVELVPVPPTAEGRLRRAVVEHVAACWDVRVEEVAGAIAADPHDVEMVLATLVAERRVVVVGIGPEARYRLAGSRARCTKRERVEGARLDDAILTQLASEPGLRAKDLTHALGLNPASVKGALDVLRADGLVETSGKARGTRYHVVVIDEAGDQHSLEAGDGQSGAPEPNGTTPSQE